MAVVRALITPRVRPGEVFAPIHWTSETASDARIDALVTPNVDPLSGQPELKAAVVGVAPYPVAWYGFAVSAAEFLPGTDYWARARARTAADWRAELAAREVPAEWELFARDLFALPDAEAMSVIDPARGLARVALSRGGRLLAALFAAPEPVAVAVARGHLAALLGGDGRGVLAGRPGDDAADPGATLCACFGVGVNTILTAIETRGLMNVEAVGAALRAGTNCGSCRPEIAALIAGARCPQAAE